MPEGCPYTLFLVTLIAVLLCYILFSNNSSQLLSTASTDVAPCADCAPEPSVPAESDKKENTVTFDKSVKPSEPQEEAQKVEATPAQTEEVSAFTGQSETDFAPF